MLSLPALLTHLQQHQYRWLSALVLLLALALTLLVSHNQRRLHMPEPWSYALAAQNFAQGKWTLTNDELAAARTEARLQGSRLTQYVEIEPGLWAFRQSPGHPLQMAPFTAIGWPRLANVTLAILAALVLYPVLAAWRGEPYAPQTAPLPPSLHTRRRWCGQGNGRFPTPFSASSTNHCVIIAPMTVQNPHDRFFRDSFGRPDIARSYLEEYLPAELRRLLDLDSLVLQDGSFIGERE